MCILVSSYYLELLWSTQYARVETCFQLSRIILMPIHRGDIYGTAGPQPRLPACGGNLYKLMVARKRFAFGPQREYFDDPFCIGWTRLGEVGKGATEGYDGGGGLAVLLSSASTKAYKSMFVGKDHAGEKWQDTLGWPSGCDSLPIAIDEKGWGMFAVGPKTAAIFVNEKHLIT